MSISFEESDRPIAMVVGADQRHANRILYLHDEEPGAEPPPRIPIRPSALLHADELARGRNAISPGDMNLICEALDKGLDLEDIEELAPDLVDRFLEAQALTRERATTDIRLPAGNFVVIPQMIEGQRQCTMAMGPSGCGKSYWTGMYIRGYHAMFPDNRVFIVSKKDEDPVFDCYDFVQRVDIKDPSFLEDEPLGPKDFTDSLVVFDDCENISDRRVKEAVYKLKDNLSETGRSENVYLVICNHLGMNFHKTRIDLNESDGYVIYKNGSSYHSKRLLEQYVGLDKAQIRRILSSPSRWVYIQKNAPRYCVTENECFLLK